MRRRWRTALVPGVLLVVFASLEGCFYMQAIGGQVEVLRSRRPLDEVINDVATDDELRTRLQMVAQARQFAVEDLLLPENGSYSSYADLERDYVVWNVFAAPEFSLQPKQWCFPVAGCVFYRGYFAEDNAMRYADKLEARGYDVSVGGVAAYSTLGRFDDPILNTMLRWSDAGLVETLFHELAHQKLYIKNDTGFNESFATAVAEIGIERWLLQRGMPAELERLQQFRQLRVDVRQRVLATMDELRQLYTSDSGESTMRTHKQRLLTELSGAAQSVIDDSGLPVRNWLSMPLNNARLVSFGAYEGNLRAFHVLWRDCEQQLECFYAAADDLAELDDASRAARLDDLKLRAGSLPGQTSRPAADPVAH